MKYAPENDWDPPQTARWVAKAAMRWYFGRLLKRLEKEKAAAEAAAAQE